MRKREEIMEVAEKYGFTRQEKLLLEVLFDIHMILRNHLPKKEKVGGEQPE